MLATLVLLVATIAFFEALSRSTTPRIARQPLATLSVKDHLAAAWAGLVLLTGLHARGRALLEVPVPDRRRRAPGGAAPHRAWAPRTAARSDPGHRQHLCSSPDVEAC